MIKRRQRKAAHIEAGGIANQETVGRVEPDVPAYGGRRTSRGDAAKNLAVNRDPASGSSANGNDPVEHCKIGCACEKSAVACR